MLADVEEVLAGLADVTLDEGLLPLRGPVGRGEVHGEDAEGLAREAEQRGGEDRRGRRPAR